MGEKGHVAVPGDDGALASTESACRRCGNSRGTPAEPPPRPRARSRPPAARPRNATSESAAAGCRRRSSLRRTAPPDSPLAIACAISALTRGMPRGRQRSTKMTPCSRAIRPPSAGAPTSLFGEKRHRLDRAENGNIEPGHVIGDDQAARGRFRAAVNPHAHAERRAQQAMEKPPARDAPRANRAIGRNGAAVRRPAETAPPRRCRARAAHISWRGAAKGGAAAHARSFRMTSAVADLPSGRR